MHELGRKKGTRIMAFEVVDVVDGDTFTVSPNWKWNDESGNRVRPIGYNTPEEGEPGHQEATDKLRKLLKGKKVELTGAKAIDRGRLVCTVKIDGNDLKDYFPEYQ